MSRSKWSWAIVVASSLSAFGCTTAVDDGVTDEETEPTASSTSEELTVSCTRHAETGYVSGSAKALTAVTVDGKLVEEHTANAYIVMAQAAKKDGIYLKVVSGFRSMAEQKYLYGCYTHCSCNSCNLAAKPGYSNHQSGHALDLNTSGSGVAHWLSLHAAHYGFKRTVPSEAWHYEWWGGGPGGGPCH